MGRVFAKAKGLGYIMWQSRHMVYHMMIGALWAWYLRERWAEFNPKWIYTAIVGSILPDIEHIFFFLGYGRRETYSKTVMDLLKHHHWRALFLFVSTGHKHNTSLAYHNLYTVVFLLLIGLFASSIDWHVGVVLLGAMVSHYLFDIWDDFLQLGHMNPNWKRFGRPR